MLLQRHVDVIPTNSKQCAQRSNVRLKTTPAVHCPLLASFLNVGLSFSSSTNINLWVMFVMDFVVLVKQVGYFIINDSYPAV
jgi:hypothetical protein